MKIAIVGSKSIDHQNENIVSQVKSFILETISQHNIDLIVSGEAKGADTIAEIIAQDWNIPAQVFKPDWSRYGRGAGPVRNAEIINHSEFVFWYY